MSDRELLVVEKVNKNKEFKDITTAEAVSAAKEVVALCDQPNDFTFSYELEGSIEEKIEAVVNPEIICGLETHIPERRGLHGHVPVYHACMVFYQHASGISS